MLKTHFGKTPLTDREREDVLAYCHIFDRIPVTNSAFAAAVVPRRDDYNSTASALVDLKHSAAQSRLLVL